LHAIPWRNFFALVCTDCLFAHLSLSELWLHQHAQTVQRVRQLLLNIPEHESRQRNGLNAFQSRLYWHCHFIQKLESEPEIEFLPMHRGYTGLREGDWNAEYFALLKAGRTGWPLVDACVAMLRETGWLNFRMRAMLVSVAAYPLWLHWRDVGCWLATQFVDYEPGIHWSQMQMQSGTTGMNVPRIYNPLKQARDHDPHGKFVRRWLPAMRKVPDSWLFEPWKMPPLMQQQLGFTPGRNYRSHRWSWSKRHALQNKDCLQCADSRKSVVQKQRSLKNTVPRQPRRQS
jgi:deoxyribodipyrimidine photo-lyase